MTDIAPPPATGVWYDVDVTLAAVLHLLRLQGGDIDAARIRDLIPVAAITIDGYVDSLVVIDGPPPAADYQYALEQATLVLYRADVPAVDLYSPMWSATMLRPLFDTVIPHRRSRWAVA